MPRRRARFSWVVAVICAGGALVVAGTPTASASVARSLDLGELVRGADRIAVVTAVSKQASWDAYARIVTDVTVRVETHVKGEKSSTTTIVMRSLGGSIGNLGMRVEGETSLAPGERALVFLRRDADQHLRSVGMSQGVMPVERRGTEDWVHPGGRGLVLQQHVGGRLVPAPPALIGPRKLTDVMGELRGLMGSTP